MHVCIYFIYKKSPKEIILYIDPTPILILIKFCPWIFQPICAVLSLKPVSSYTVHFYIRAYVQVSEKATICHIFGGEWLYSMSNSRGFARNGDPKL